MKKLLLLSGGVGSRTSLKIPKQYLKINNKEIIIHLLERCENLFDEIYIVIDPEYNNIVSSFTSNLIKNGSTRIQSLQNGLKEIDLNNDDILFIHEAARPLLTKKDIQLHINSTKEGMATVTTSSVKDTMFVIENKIIKKSISKVNIVAGWNPQSYFAKDIISMMDVILSTKDDKDLTEILAGKITYQVVDNIGDLRKITTDEDIEWIKGVL